MKRLFRLPFSRDRMRRAVDTELDFHVEGRIEELVAAGMPREDAEREARSRFGNRERVEAEMERIDLSTHKRRALADRLDDISRSATFALRQFRRSLGFTFVVTATLALGIGATTAIYTVLDSAAGGLMLRSFSNLQAVKPGLDPQGVLTFSTVLDGAISSPAEAAVMVQQLQVRFAALPGVTQVGASDALPLQDFGSGCTAAVREGALDDGSRKGGCVATPAVIPGFFESLGMRVETGGRLPRWTDFDMTERTATVAVITRALANDFWPGEDPLGKGISIGDRYMMKQYYRIVGVLVDVHAKGLDQAPIEAVFPLEAMAEPVWTLKVASGNPALLLPAIRRALHDLAPRAPLVDARLMTDVVSRSTARTSFVMTLLLIAAFAALALSAVGIYGVISYLVAQRRTEIGVRVALGARTPQIASLVLGQTMRLALAGIAIGLVGAFIAARLLKSLLFGVSPTDALVLAGTCAALLIIAAVASLVPTRRAAKIDPVEAMRAS